MKNKTNKFNFQTAFDLMSKGHTDKVIEGFKTLETDIWQLNRIALKYGPLNKNKYTTQLEKLVEKLLTTDINKIKCKVSCPTGKKYSPTQIWLKIGNENYNITKIVKKANMQQIVITNKHYYESFEKYLKTESLWQPVAAPHATSGNLTSKKDFLRMINEYKNTYNIKEHLAVEDLEYGEMVAINCYTSGYFDDINQFAKGIWKPKNWKSTDNKQNVKEIKNMILHTFFCNAGLNRVPATCLPNVYRGERFEASAKPGVQHGKNLLNEIKQSIKSGGKPIIMQTFVSTSMPQKDEMPEFFSSTSMIIDNVIGQVVAGISAEPDEREILIPKNTKIRWNNIVEDKTQKHLHVFAYGTCVRNLEETPERIIQEELLAHLKILKTIYKESKVNLPEKDRQSYKEIQDLLLNASKIALKNDSNLLKKYHQITKILDTIENKMETNSKYNFYIKTKNSGIFFKNILDTKKIRKKIDQVLLSSEISEAPNINQKLKD